MFDGTPAKKVENDPVIELSTKYADEYLRYMDVMYERSKTHDMIRAERGGQSYFNKQSDEIKNADIYFIQHDGAPLLSYLAAKAKREGISLLEEIRRIKPPEYTLDLEHAYHILAEHLGEPFNEAFLSKYAARRTPFSAYPGISPEAASISAEIYQQMGIKHVAPANMVSCSTGTNGMWYVTLSTLLTTGAGGDRKPVEGKKTILTERNVYNFCALGAAHLGAQLALVHELTPKSLEGALKRRKELGIRAIYLQGLRNPDGHIRTAEEIHALAEVILKYNKAHPKDPVYVIEDQVYYGAQLGDKKVMPLASMRIDGLGDMFDYSVVLHSTSKTYALASSRLGWAASGVQGDKGPTPTRLMEAAYDLNIHQPSAAGAHMGMATLALTKQKEIDHRSVYYSQQFDALQAYVDEVNTAFGSQLLSVEKPDGSWFAMLRFDKSKLPAAIKTSTDLGVYMMRYGTDKKTGVVTHPARLFGYEMGDWKEDQQELSLRATLSMSPEEIKEMFDRIKTAMVKLKTLPEPELKVLLKPAEKQRPQVKA
jgi:aspartate/methionine/tyrosine aminotransferase